jgi:hypothetical protein
MNEGLSQAALKQDFVAQSLVVFAICADSILMMQLTTSLN